MSVLRKPLVRRNPFLSFPHSLSLATYSRPQRSVLSTYLYSLSLQTPRVRSPHRVSILQYWMPPWHLTSYFLKINRGVVSRHFRSWCPVQWVPGNYLYSSSLISNMRPFSPGSHTDLSKLGVLSDSSGMMDLRTLSRNVGRGVFKGGPIFPSQPCPWVTLPSSLATQPLSISLCKYPPFSWPIIYINKPMGNSNDWDWEDVMSEWVDDMNHTTYTQSGSHLA